MTEPPLVPGSVTGVRAWRVDQNANLWPMSMRLAPPWEPGENRSRCFAQPGPFELCNNPTCSMCRAARLGQGHDFHAQCSCGFYGVFNPNIVPSGGFGEPIIVGVIQAYGRVVLGPQGFRAAKARIVALAGPHTRQARRITAERYAAEVTRRLWEIPTFPDLDAALTEFPPTIPKEYLEGPTQ